MARLATPPPDSSLEEWSRRLACLVCIVIPILLLGLLLHQKPLESQFRLRWDDLRLSAVPPMPVKDFLNEVRAAGQFQEELNLHETELLERLRETIQRHEWVESVQRVALVSPRQLQVDLTFRKPVAKIENGSQVHWVDQHGKLLLPVAQKWKWNLISIVGWNDRQEESSQWLVQAAKTAQQLENDVSQWNLSSIQIANYPALDVSELRLKTKGGTSIIWQTLKGSNVEEPTFEEKKSRIRIYLERYGTLDVPAGYVLDVRVKEGLQRKPVQ
ncbi:MAG: hypothetical protein JNJ77_00315 [Planctomycetia bacterium]|nr:hypothetical protein [Planctomycetia bacterium]